MGITERLLSQSSCSKNSIIFSLSSCLNNMGMSRFPDHMHHTCIPTNDFKANKCESIICNLPQPHVDVFYLMRHSKAINDSVISQETAPSLKCYRECRQRASAMLHTQNRRLCLRHR